MLCNVAASHIYDGDSVSSAGRFIEKFQSTSWSQGVTSGEMFTAIDVKVKYSLASITKKNIIKMESDGPRTTCGVICALSSDLYDLLEPLTVTIEIYDDEVIAIIPELELYGEGLTEIEAMDDLEIELVELCQYLSSIPVRKLGKLPRAWKKILDAKIVPKSGN